MFTRANKIISNIEELGNYIEGFDVYNSLFLNSILDPNLERVSYRITRFEYRPDLIAEEIYGSSSYSAILLISTGKRVSDLTAGTVLYVVPKSTVDEIIRNL